MLQVYADCWYVNGTVSIPTQGFEGALSSTWQPVWDSWQRFVQPLVSQVSTYHLVNLSTFSYIICFIFERSSVIGTHANDSLMHLEELWPYA